MAMMLQVDIQLMENILEALVRRFEMYNELDKFLSEDYSISYFYDDGFEEGIELLSKFTDDDWHMLFKNCNENTDEWKIRLAYCLGAYGDIKGLDTLISIAINNNGEVFEYAIDALRDFSPDNMQGDQKDKVIEKIKQASLSADSVAKKVFDKFLENYL